MIIRTPMESRIILEMDQRTAIGIEPVYHRKGENWIARSLSEGEAFARLDFRNFRFRPQCPAIQFFAGQVGLCPLSTRHLVTLFWISVTIRSQRGHIRA